MQSTQTDIRDTTIILHRNLGTKGCRKVPQSPKTMDPLVIYIHNPLKCKFYYEKALGAKVLITICCPICEYPMKEIHWFWPKTIESA